MTDTIHPSDEQLTAFFDKQLPDHKHTPIQDHVAACAECTAVLGDFAVLEDMGPLVEESLPGDLYWEDLPDRILARIASGALITMHGMGRTIPSLGSDIRVFCEGAMLRTGIWGERLELQRAGETTLSPVESVVPGTVWQQFLDVREGRIPNPSPPEIGLRMARLWDAIRESAANGGAVVRLGVPA